MKTITFVTGNQSKIEHLAKEFDYKFENIDFDLAEIQSLDLDEVAARKAKDAFAKLKSPVLVEDASLKFNALGNLPGPLIRWFLNELGNEGLCQLIDRNEDRSALAEVAYGFYDGKNLKIFRGAVRGKIAEIPQGGDGFGWDSVFIPDGFDETWAQMSREAAVSSGMRKIALEKLKNFLAKNIDS